MRIVIIGANGQLGHDVHAHLSQDFDDLIPLTHAEIQIENEACIEQIEVMKPDVVINTAAMHNVMACELDPAKAFLVNAMGSRNLARAAKRINAYLMHVSTDYVFNGDKFDKYVEADVPKPLNVYGVSKLAGEHFIQAEGGRHAILRVSGLYGSSPCRAKNSLNFVQTMLKLADEGKTIDVVTNEFTAPTYTKHIAYQMAVLLFKQPEGLFHCAAHGGLSWYDFAHAIFEIAGLQPDLRRVPAKHNGVKRPRYSIMDNAHLREIGYDMMVEWRTGLSHYMSTIGRNKRAA